jgi:hypothetical protein
MFNRRQTAQTGTGDTADARTVSGIYLKPGILHGHPGGSQGVMKENVKPSDLLFIQKIRRLKIGYLPCNL